ncbi:acetyl-CoA hydrolase/transferase [Parafrankia sp. EUN1f]|nr:acetyl-CoA hydrolase/transferase [Parafrankia sp. EUN1f]
MRPEQLDLTSFVRAGDLVMWGQACARPIGLTAVLADQAAQIGPVRCFAGLGIDDPTGRSVLDAPAVVTMSYTGMGHRRAEAAGRLEVLPAHYSAIAAAIDDRRLVVDVALVQATRAAPDGLHRLALAADYMEAALRHARVVIAEVNEQAPLVVDAPVVRPERVAAWVESSYEPLTSPPSESGAVERMISAHIADLVQDGSTLQVGLGKVPEAVVAALVDRRELGIHSGTVGDALARLVETGAVTNAKKGRDHGVSVTGLVMGSRAVFDAVDDNPSFALRPIGYTHDPDVLASLRQLVTINSAIEVDLSGQVNCEVAAGRYVGAVGGALDFLRGASRSRGGLPIIALPSTAGGRSRIVNTLSGPVTIPRGDAPIVVTEHGVADLRGLSLARRRECLLAVADPAHVTALEHSQPVPGNLSTRESP